MPWTVIAQQRPFPARRNCAHSPNACVILRWDGSERFIQMNENSACFGYFLIFSLTAVMPATSPQLRTPLLARCLAAQISNPVLRLRFLRAFAPPWEAPPRKSRRGWVLGSFLVVSLLFTAPPSPPSSPSSPRVKTANQTPSPSP